MFEYLARRWPVIIVTGPQRSGTTIATQMIAADTGFRAVDESQYGTHDQLRFWNIIADENAFGLVVQAPTMFAFILEHDVPGLVVLMRRPLSEIHASQDRIDWRAQYEHHEHASLGVRSGDSAAIKYERWDRGPRPHPYAEIVYDDLREHPLWVDARDRKHFHAKQTAP